MDENQNQNTGFQLGNPNEQTPPQQEVQQHLPEVNLPEVATPEIVATEKKSLADFFKTKQGKLIAGLVALAFVAGIIFVTSTGGQLFKGQFFGEQACPAGELCLSAETENVSVSLKWQDNTQEGKDGKIKGYEIFRSKYSKGDNVSMDIKKQETKSVTKFSPGTGATISDNFLEEGTYYYTLISYNEDGTFAKTSKELKVELKKEEGKKEEGAQKPGGYEPKPGYAVSNGDGKIVKLSLSAGDGTAILSWIDENKFEDLQKITYEVLRSEEPKITTDKADELKIASFVALDGDDSYKVTTKDGKESTSNQTVFNDTGLTNGKNYYYAVRTVAKTEIFSEGLSNEVIGIPEAGAQAVQPPGSDVGTGTGTDTNTAGEEGGGTQPPAGDTSGTDTGTKAKEVVKIKLELVEVNEAESKVKLKWTDSNFKDTEYSTRKYKVYRADTPGVDPKVIGFDVATMELTTTEFADPIPDAKKTYYYQVTAEGPQVPAGNEVDSNVVVAKSGIGTENQVPNKPSLWLPAKDAVNVELTPTLRWNDAGDPDNKPQNFRNYKWYIKEKGTNTVVWDRGWKATGETDKSCAKTDGTWTCDKAIVPAGKLQQDKTYVWAVEAGDGTAGSGFSEEWTFSTGAGEVVAPNPPTNVAAKETTVQTSGGTATPAVEISWTAPQGTISGYSMYRKEGEIATAPKLEELNTWTKLGPPNDLNFLVPANVTKLNDLNVDMTKVWSYVVISENQAKKSAPSNVAVFKKTGPAGVITLTGNLVGNNVELSWTDTTPEDKVEKYTIERKEKNSTAPATLSTLTSKGSDGKWDDADRKKTDDLTESGKTYEYAIRGELKNAPEGEYIISNKIEKTIPAAQLTAPANLTATVKFEAASKGVTLQWDKVDGADGYIVYRKLGTQTAPSTADLKDTTKGWEKKLPSGAQKIAPPTDAATKPNFFDNNPEKLTTDPYSYVVTAVKGTQESGPSNVAASNPSATQTPQTINLTATASDKTVKLTWTDSNDASKVGMYDIYRSTKTPLKISDAETKYVGEKDGAAAKEYTDTGLTNGTQYYYIVIAGDKAGEFDVGISNEAPAKPAAPAVDPNKQACDTGINDLKNKKSTFDLNKTQANADSYNALYNQLVGKACVMPPESELPKLLSGVPTGPTAQELACQEGVKNLQNIYSSFLVNQTPELAALYNATRQSLKTQNCALNASMPEIVAGNITPPPFEDEPEATPPPAAEEVVEQQPKVITKVVYKEVPVEVQPMTPAETAPAQVLHPVAGNYVPKQTAKTGPEMWIYAVPALASAWGSRRILVRKKKK